MDCHDAKERLKEGRRGVAVRRHLSDCSDCSAYSRELEDGGRALAESFLATPPSAGFEERVLARAAEREISVPRKPVSRWKPALASAAVVLLAVGAYLLFRPPAPLGSREVAPARAGGSTSGAITDPLGENPLEIRLWRGESASPTEMVVSFAGESSPLRMAGNVERELSEAWRRGARRVELHVGPAVPGGEIIEILEVMEKLGFSYEIQRQKP